MANNNFFLNNDPLLFGNNSQQGPDMSRQQLEELLIQYRNSQNQQDQRYDYLGELDSLSKDIKNGAFDKLQSNKEYIRLNTELQTIIQNELMSNIKWKINSNPKAIKNIERQISIIKEANSVIEEEERKNLNELNDYIKNYSNMTFDEYKRIKNNVSSDDSEPQQQVNNKNKKINNK